MQKRNKFFKVICCVICVILLYGTQVSGNFNDVLNPVFTNLDGWHQRDARVAIKENTDPVCERPNIYICEEPPDTVPPDASKACNYRNLDYHEQVFRWVAGWGCLLFTPDFLYVGGTNTINLSAGCLYGNWLAPCLEIVKDDGSCGCYPFDPSLEEVVTAVNEALLPTAHGRWERCFYTATDCCSHFMNINQNSTNQCKTTFDGWTCWVDAEAGTLVHEVCSEFAYSNTGPTCHHYSSKQCYDNGTWEIQTDYSTCSISDRLVRRYHFHIAMLSFSLVSCVPAVFIFFFYKRLRIPRVALHRNLLIAILVRNILVIVSRTEVYIDELTSSSDVTSVLSSHGVGCRVLAFAERFAVNAVFVSMLVDGVYLHRSIVAVFRKKLKLSLLYGIGTAIALGPALVWTSVMATLNDHSCWIVYTVPNIQWILDGPRLVILLVNTGLFIDILRVLLTKIRNSENVNQLSTTKATLFLMPLFGTQFILTAFRPSTTNCTAEQIYYYVSYTVEGLQGFIVALLYCYINKEVRGLIKSTYRKTETAVVSRIRRDSSYPHLSNDPNRRVTYSTELPSGVDEAKAQYASIPPRLQVAEIISIQASERLAEILEPVYETIQNGITNEGYDSLDRTDVDNDSGFIHNRDSKAEDDYGFTNASSVSIDCQDWIRCISSPSSSVYNNSLNDYEAKYLEKKFPNHPKLKEARSKSTPNIPDENLEVDSVRTSNVNDKKDIGHEHRDSEATAQEEPEYEECLNMLDEILNYLESTENENKNESSI